MSTVFFFSFKAPISHRLPHISSCVRCSGCATVYQPRWEADASALCSLSVCYHPSWTALGGYYLGAINTASWVLNEMIVGVISPYEGRIWWLQRRCHPVERLPSGANMFPIKRNSASTIDANNSNDMLNWSDMMVPRMEQHMNIKSIISPLNICMNVCVWECYSLCGIWGEKKIQFIIFSINLCALQSA